MSSYAGRCAICGKDVMHKTLFGTLHLCLSSEERYASQMLEQQKRGNDLMSQLAKRYPKIDNPIKDRSK